MSRRHDGLAAQGQEGRGEGRETARLRGESHGKLPGRKGLLLVLSGPSGTGKTTLAYRLIERHGGRGTRLQRSVSVTTRPPRPGEVKGRDYDFVTQEQFAQLACRGELLEQAEMYGHYYGTRRGFVEDRLGRGVDVLLVLDACGRDQIARTCGRDLVSIFLLPPGWQELQKRLCDRTEDDDGTIARRLASARHEIARCAEYDYILVNDDLDQTVESLDVILGAERLRRHRLSLAAAWFALDIPEGQSTHSPGRYQRARPFGEVVDRERAELLEAPGESNVR